MSDACAVLLQSPAIRASLTHALTRLRFGEHLNMVPDGRNAPAWPHDSNRDLVRAGLFSRIRHGLVLCELVKDRTGCFRYPVVLDVTTMRRKPDATWEQHVDEKRRAVFSADEILDDAATPLVPFAELRDLAANSRLEALGRAALVLAAGEAAWWNRVGVERLGAPHDGNLITVEV